MKKIIKGMFRPLWEDIFKKYNRTDVYKSCCNCGQEVVDSRELREHWQCGHFDEIVYED
jgi:hypothetical protein